MSRIFLCYVFCGLNFCSNCAGRFLFPPFQDTVFFPSRIVCCMSLYFLLLLQCAQLVNHPSFLLLSSPSCVGVNVCRCLLHLNSMGVRRQSSPMFTPVARANIIGWSPFFYTCARTHSVGPLNRAPVMRWPATFHSSLFLCVFFFWRCLLLGCGVS